MPKLSITRKLVIIYLVVAVPLVATLVISYYSWYKGRVNRVMVERNEVADLIGTSFALQILEIDRSMKLAGRTIIDNHYSQSKTVDMLLDLKSLYPAEFVLITDSSGIVKASTDSRLIGTDLSNNPAFAVILFDNKQTGITPTERVNETVGFYTTQAIKSDNKLQGIVACFIGVSKLSISLPVKVRIGEANIVDSSGRLVYQSGHPNLALSNPYWGKYLFIREAISGKEAGSTNWVFPGSGKTNYVSEIPIKEIGWVAGSSIDRDLVLKPIVRAAFRLKVAVISIVLLTLLISISIARIIVRSLSVLVEKSSAIGQGYLDEPVVLNTGDEIEEVAHSLDSARLNLKHKVEELQKSRMELEMRVEERTGELSNVVSRMQSLLESTDEGIYGTDKDGICIVFNKSASIMTGFELEDVMGKTIHGLIHCKHEDGSPYLLEDCLIEQVVNTGNKIRVSTEVFWRKNGTSFPVEYSACPILEEGVVKGVVVAFTDITQRKRAEELSSALAEINADISSTLEIDQIMQKVVGKATKAIGAESGVILIRANDKWIVSHSFGSLEEMTGKQFDSVEIKRVIEFAEDGKSFVFNENNYKRDEPGRIANQYNIKSCICVPLSTKDNLIGILAVVYHSTPTLFTKIQIDFVDKLAFSISLALENARLYQEESNIADTLQEALLVLPEKIEGISFDHLYRSATVAARVGGDFYDLFELEHKRVGIIIGDVSGKGIEASALTSIIKSTLRAFAYEGHSPAVILSKTNSIIVKTSPPGLFVTLFFGILEIATGNLVYCNAGHPAPVIRRERSQIVLLDANSPIVGAFPELQFLDDTAILAENDTLILYTDGAIEARYDGGFVGEEKLIEIIKQIEPAMSRNLPDLIFDNIIKYTGQNLSDDIAILAISRADKTN